MPAPVSGARTGPPGGSIQNLREEDGDATDATVDGRLALHADAAADEEPPYETTWLSRVPAGVLEFASLEFMDDNRAFSDDSVTPAWPAPCAGRFTRLEALLGRVEPVGVSGTVGSPCVVPGATDTLASRCCAAAAEVGDAMVRGAEDGVAGPAPGGKLASDGSSGAVFFTPFSATMGIAFTAPVVAGRVMGACAAGAAAAWSSGAPTVGRGAPGTYTAPPPMAVVVAAGRDASPGRRDSLPRDGSPASAPRGVSRADVGCRGLALPKSIFNACDCRPGRTDAAAGLVTTGPRPVSTRARALLVRGLDVARTACPTCNASDAMVVPDPSCAAPPPADDDALLLMRGVLRDVLSVRGLAASMCCMAETGLTRVAEALRGRAPPPPRKWDDDSICCSSARAALLSPPLAAPGGGIPLRTGAARGDATSVSMADGAVERGALMPYFASTAAPGLGLAAGPLDVAYDTGAPGMRNRPRDRERCPYPLLLELA